MKEVILWKLRLLMNLGKATNKGSMILWKLRLLMNLGKATNEGSHLVEAKTVNEFR